MPAHKGSARLSWPGWLVSSEIHVLHGYVLHQCITTTIVPSKRLKPIKLLEGIGSGGNGPLIWSTATCELRSTFHTFTICWSLWGTVASWVPTDLYFMSILACTTLLPNANFGLSDWGYWSSGLIYLSGTVYSDSMIWHVQWTHTGERRSSYSGRTRRRLWRLRLLRSKQTWLRWGYSGTDPWRSALMHSLIVNKRADHARV